jgi:RHS repeat-associated protein
VLDDQGNVVERRDFHPYGQERLIDTQPDATKTDHKFTGKELDDETNLYYYGARYYDPLTNRFLTLDPWAGELSNPQSLNKYAYVLNNPLKFIDPTGMYNMPTGEVEEGDTLGSITGELNNYFGTRLSYQDLAKINSISDPNRIEIGQIVKMGTINADGSTWQRSYNADEVTIGYWNGLTQSQQKITHYGRNLFQDNLPATGSELKFWQWNNMGESIAHNLDGASGNIDYRGKGLNIGQQAIYDQNGYLVETPENMGTYDFIPPTVSLSGHGTVDVEPWIEWGNSPQDSTSKWDRQKAYTLGILKAGSNLIQSLTE